MQVKLDRIKDCPLLGPVDLLTVEPSLLFYLRLLLEEEDINSCLFLNRQHDVERKNSRWEIELSSPNLFTTMITVTLQKIG